MFTRLALTLIAMILPIGAVLADSCDDTAARIAAAVPGLTFKARYDPKPPPPGIEPSSTIEIHFQHRFGGTIEIFCYPGTQPTVTVDTDSPYPTQAFLDFVSKIGAAETGAPARSIRQALIRTHRSALRGEPDTDAQVDGAGIVCHVFNDRDPKLTQFEIKKLAKN